MPSTNVVVRGVTAVDIDLEKITANGTDKHVINIRVTNTDGTIIDVLLYCVDTNVVTTMTDRR